MPFGRWNSSKPTSSAATKIYTFSHSGSPQCSIFKIIVQNSFRYFFLFTLRETKVEKKCEVAVPNLGLHCQKFAEFLLCSSCVMTESAVLERYVCMDPLFGSSVAVRVHSSQPVAVLGLPSVPPKYIGSAAVTAASRGPRQQHLGPSPKRNRVTNCNYVSVCSADVGFASPTSGIHRVVLP